MQEILKHASHRPWPLPARPWIIRQTWEHLLFAHWELPPAVLSAKIPPPLELDLYRRRAFLAVTPFQMSGVRLRGLPPIPGASAFPELNVRTYVRFRDKPGVFFFSLDAASRLAVWGARTSFHLPYFHAAMQVRLDGESVDYRSRRNSGAAELAARYRPVAPIRLREKGTLETFLTERYCLFTVRKSKVFSADIHHVPWPLQDAQAQFETNTMAAASGIALPEAPPLLHFARRLDVLVWPLQKLA